MAHILAIDQSTSATKVVLFDELGTVRGRESIEHQQIYPQPGWVEHDADEIWQNLLSCVSTLANRTREQVADLVAISIANQRETVLVFDRETGRPLHNAIVWQCRRGDAVCEELREAGHEELIHRKTGLRLDTYFSGSKLSWLMRNQPEIANRLRDGSALMGTIDAYLIYRLTSGRVFATDHTNASRTLLFDIGQLEWDAELCALFDVPSEALPEVRESAAEYGLSDIQGALPQPVPICGVMGDSQASLFAQRCFDRGMGKATFGTGTSILLNVGSQRPQSPGGAVEALAWVWRGTPTYALEGIINYSSATLVWLRDQLELIGGPAECEALAQTVEDNSGVYLVPAFAGLSAPYWNAEARAAIVGMTAYSRKAHVARAALESIAYQIRDVLEMMRDGAGVAPQLLFADGGPTRNEFLMQFTADIARVDLVVAEVSESSAWGAAQAGLLGMNVYGSLEEMRALPREVSEYRPQLAIDAAHRLHCGWKRAVEQTLHGYQK